MGSNVTVCVGVGLRGGQLCQVGCHQTRMTGVRWCLYIVQKVGRSETLGYGLCITGTVSGQVLCCNYPLRSRVGVTMFTRPREVELWAHTGKNRFVFVIILQVAPDHTDR